MGNELEIDKMLILSTAHIKESTAKALDNQEIQGLAVYPKEEYGWFIFLNVLGSEDILSDIPEDLMEVIKLAQKNNCFCLCLDRDGRVTEKLPVYNW